MQFFRKQVPQKNFWQNNDFVKKLYTKKFTKNNIWRTLEKKIKKHNFEKFFKIQPENIYEMWFWKLLLEWVCKQGLK